MGSLPLLVQRRSAGINCDAHDVSVAQDADATERLVAAAANVCRSMLAGDVTPYECAQKIAAMCRRESIHPPAELHAFVYADSEWDERPADANLFAEGVVAAARDLVASPHSPG